MALKVTTLSLVICLLGWPIAASSQSAYGTLSFSPAHPTTDDAITVILNPAEGGPNWCAFESGVYGHNNIAVIAFPFNCSDGYGTQNFAVIGKLPAGSYDVIWTFTDNFDQVPVPTATLTVIDVPVQLSTLSVVGILSLACGVLLIGLYQCTRLGNAR
jgi:hypothetical protein